MKTEQEIKDFLLKLEEAEKASGRKKPIRTGEIMGLKWVLGLYDITTN